MHLCRRLSQDYLQKVFLSLSLFTSFIQLTEWSTIHWFFAPCGYQTRKVCPECLNISCLERLTYTRKATPPVWLRLCQAGTGEDPCRWNPCNCHFTWHCNIPQTHPEPPVQLPTPENLHTRDMAKPPEPIPAQGMFDPHPNTSLPSCPAKMKLRWLSSGF